VETRSCIYLICDHRPRPAGESASTALWRLRMLCRKTSRHSNAISKNPTTSATRPAIEPHLQCDIHLVQPGWRLITLAIRRDSFVTCPTGRMSEMRALGIVFKEARAIITFLFPVK
jgi:hypothetical protein